MRFKKSVRQRTYRAPKIPRTNEMRPPVRIGAVFMGRRSTWWRAGWKTWKP